MERTKDIAGFVEFEYGKNLVIEPSERFIHVRERLLDVVGTYHPGVIVKAGVGRGDLLLALAGASDALVVVVDYSLECIKRFKQANSGNKALEKIYFIVGAFESFPIDYYAADLLVSVDYFDFVETGAVIDEFRRSLQFDGVLFISAEVLSDEDLDGVYDEFMAALFPLHNDMYLQSDMKTFLTLNEFKFIKGDASSFTADSGKLVEHYASFSPVDRGAVRDFMDAHRETLESLYGLRDGSMNVPYFIGVFMREKIK